MSKRAGRIAALSVLFALAACGGGGSDGKPSGVALAWEKSTYSVVAPVGGTNSIGLQTEVRVTGSNLPPQIAIDVTPSGSGEPITTENGPHWVNSTGAAPVTLVVNNPGAGYAYGDHTYTAKTTIDGVIYSATATLSVTP